MTAPLLLLSLLVLLASSFTRPQHATCPPNWATYAIHRDGLFTCGHPYSCQDHFSLHGGWTSECEGLSELAGRIYCTGGSRPVTNDGVTVGCQRYAE